MPHSLATQGHWPRTSPWLEHRPGARLRRISASNRHLPPARSIKFAISSVVSARRSKTTGGSVTFGPAPGASVGLGEATAQAIASLSAGATATTIGAAASGGSAAGAATAFNADMNNRQLHPDERQLAAELARKSGGKYTAEQIENALRNAGNTETGESVVAGLVVNPQDRDAIFDKGAVWRVGENGLLVQVLPPQPDAGLVTFIQQNTGPTYDWYAPSSNAGSTSTGGPRDRLTNLPLDDKGRYSQTVVLDGKAFEPKYLPCATTACSQSGANLDLNDPGTQAYVKALDQQVFKDIGTGATLLSLITPVGVPGAALAVVGAGAAVGEAALSGDSLGALRDTGIEAGSEKSAQIFFEKVLGHPPAAAARFVALINLSGGWEAFRERVKVDLLGVNPNE